MTPVIARMASLAATCLLAQAAGAEQLRQWKDKNGVTHLDDGHPAPASNVHKWVDKAGTTHITIGPSLKARQQAQQLTMLTEATGEAAKVHDVPDWDAQIAEAARKYNIPQELVRAIIVAESNFRPNAKSRVGALGLMQLMPHTAAAMYVNDLTDPVQNIFGGTRYLRVLANMFGGDLIKTIAAYNAGPDAVRKASGIPPFAETQAYVRRVRKLFRIYRGL